jgi:DNA-binding transcriptional MerR regulator
MNVWASSKSLREQRLVIACIHPKPTLEADHGDKANLSRVFLIRNALAVGFSLDELTRILRLRDSGQVPCREVAEMAQEKVNALDLQIEQLIELRNSLKLTVKEWERRLKKTAAGNRAGLLESLPQRKGHRTTEKKGRTA